MLQHIGLMKTHTSLALPAQAPSPTSVSSPARTARPKRAGEAAATSIATSMASPAARSSKRSQSSQKRADKLSSRDRASVFNDRVHRRQNEELFRMLPASVAFSYIASLATLGVLYLTNDAVRGVYWFAYATGVLMLRSGLIWAFSRRDEIHLPPATWSRLVIGANFLAGVQWGLLGTWLFEAEPAFRAMFVAVVLVGYIAGAAVTFSPVRFAHTALAVPAILPPIIYVFFMRADGNVLVGVMSLFMLAAVMYLCEFQHRSFRERITLEIENDALVRRISEHNTTLGQDIDNLKHQSEVVKRAQLDARRRIALLNGHVQETLVPVFECDRESRVLEWNRAAESAYGYRIGWFGERTLADVIAPLDNTLTWSGAIVQACEARQPAQIDVIVLCADGQRRTQRLYLTPIVIEGFTTARIAVIAMDLDDKPAAAA
jgi:PAS domain-containing protein